MAESVQNMPGPLRERATAPIGGDGASCKPSCYEYPMQLPAACKVDQGRTSCVCRRAGDAGSVRRYREAASVTDEGERRAPVFFAPSLAAGSPAGMAALFRYPEILASPGLSPNARLVQVGEDPETEVPEEAIPEWIPKGASWADSHQVTLGGIRRRIIVLPKPKSSA
ncbi:hypothetical protein DL765_004405 [Monosporascus sp. GIB2]|nr:hypothetical protein DL765_004405 [Monosporascus sp. GIB2]